MEVHTSTAALFIYLLTNILVFPFAGCEGNLSLLDIFGFLSREIQQMDVFLVTMSFVTFPWLLLGNLLHFCLLWFTGKFPLNC